jgi:hypothetical protein
VGVHDCLDDVLAATRKLQFVKLKYKGLETIVAAPVFDTPVPSGPARTSSLLTTGGVRSIITATESWWRSITLPTVR